MEKVTSQWLEETNAEFIQQGITGGEEKIRLAVAKWRKDNVPSFQADKNLDFEMLRRHLEIQDDKIKSYFLTQTAKDRGYIQPPFVGLYYFQGNFWEIVVPFVLGRVGINIFDCLKMPHQLQRILASDEESLQEYITVWADCLDYAYAINEVEYKCGNDFSRELFKSADKHLRATISLLNQEKASSKSIEDARMSIEIFLKAYLSVKENLTDEDLRKQIGHHLDKGIDRCVNNGLNELTQIKNKLHLFPEIHSRYAATERTLGELWTAFRLSHTTGTTILRNLTGRDCRNTIKLNS
jgi:predicted transposase YbfD/YdcC